MWRSGYSFVFFHVESRCLSALCWMAQSSPEDLCVSSGMFHFPCVCSGLSGPLYSISLVYLYIPLLTPPLIAIFLMSVGISGGLLAIVLFLFRMSSLFLGLGSFMKFYKQLVPFLKSIRGKSDWKCIQFLNDLGRMYIFKMSLPYHDQCVSLLCFTYFFNIFS